MGKFTIDISWKARKELQVQYGSGNKSEIRLTDEPFLAFVADMLDLANVFKVLRR